MELSLSDLTSQPHAVARGQEKSLQDVLSAFSEVIASQRGEGIGKLPSVHNDLIELIIP